MSQAEIRQMWEDRIAACRASGLSISKWCAAHQVKCHQFYYWHRKLRSAETTTPQWVAVNVDQQPVQASEPSLLVKVGAAVIEVKPGYNRTLLSDIVRTLQTLC